MFLSNIPLLRRLLRRIIHHLPPTSEHLSELSRRDRPGLRIQVPDSQLMLGRQYLQTGSIEQALHHFEQAITDNSQDSWAWHGKGDSLQAKKDYINALKAYTMATQLAPDEGLHWGGQANAHQGLNDQESCTACRKRALQLDPSLHWMFGEDP